MGITTNFILVLSAMLILPLLPAFILYKFLPSKTNVSGPFKGLNLKLTGAFGGYFLLVITSIAVFFPLLGNEQMQVINRQKEEIARLQQAAAGTEQWEIQGNIVSSSPKLTKVFFDETGGKFFETGEFSLPFECDLKNGKADLPKAVCIFNKDDGYKVLNISRDFRSDDIKNYAISFNDSSRLIRIDSAIDIQTKEAARIETEKALIKKLKLENLIHYDPEKTSRIIKPGLSTFRNLQLNRDST